jgi:hypothetical protein
MTEAIPMNGLIGTVRSHAVIGISVSVDGQLFCSSHSDALRTHIFVPPDWIS